MIYLTCFAVSAVLSYFANKTQKRKLFWLFSVLSILVMVMLAGLRDYSVGIDTSSYMSLPRFWKGAVKYDTLGEYLNFYKGTGLGEYLFVLILGTIEQLCGNYSVFLLVAHAIIITGMYVGAYRMRQYARPWLVLLLFYLIFFNQSLNILRQYMAMAVVFAVLVDVPQKKYLRFALVVILAAQIHRSALLSFGILAIDWYLSCDLDRIVHFPRKAGAWLRKHLTKGQEPAEQEPGKEKRVPRFQGRGLRLPDPFTPTIPQRQVIMFVGLLLLVVIFNPLCRFLIAIGLMPEKYSFYLDFAKAEYNLLSTLFMLVEMAALLFLRKFIRKQIRDFDFFFSNSLAYLALQQMSFFLVYGKRIALYFSLPNLITITMICGVYKNKNKRAVVTVMVILVALVYWLYVYALRNASQTMPYKLVF